MNIWGPFFNSIKKILMPFLVEIEFSLMILSGLLLLLTIFFSQNLLIKQKVNVI